MTNYTEAAQSGATVLLSDGTTVRLAFNPAGTNGWIDPVIISWTDHDDYLTWNTDGRALGHDAHIVDIV
jgi:hypothetical protein